MTALPSSVETSSSEDATKSQNETSNSKTAVSNTWLRLPCCDHAVHPVSIEHHEDSEIIVTPPKSPHETWVTPPESDVVFTIGWNNSGGSFALNCQLAEHGDSNWKLRVVGEAEFIQRRRHVRVTTCARVQILDTEHDRTVGGTMLDLSETGMRCSFTEWPIPGYDGPIRITTRLDGSLLVLRAEPMWTGRISEREIHVGFQFTDLHYSVAGRILHHVEQRLEELKTESKD